MALIRYEMGTAFDQFFASGALYGREIFLELAAAGGVVAAFFLARVLDRKARAAHKRQLSDAAGALTREIAKRVSVEEQLAQTLENERLATALLNDRERQAHLGFKAAQLGTWTLEHPSGAVTCDAQSRALYGLAGDLPTIDMDRLFARIHADDAEKVRNAIAAAFENQSGYNLEFRVAHADGSSRWVGAQGSVSGGEPRGAFDTSAQLKITGINLDIHTRKTAELALEESERQFHLLADSIPQLAWMADASGSRVWYNRRWYEYTGTTQAQTLGAGWQTLYHPAERGSIIEQWRDCVGSARPLSLECRVLGADGNYRWFLTLATPVVDSAGNVTRWFGTETDITQLREIADALYESDRQFSQIADSMPQMVWMAGQDGRVEWWNSQWYVYTGTTPAETGGNGWGSQVHQQDTALTFETWHRSVQTGELFELENRILRHDGVYRWFLGRGVPVRDSLGNVVKWFGTLTDIEDYKQAGAKIQCLNGTLELRVVERTAELAAANQILADTQSQLQAILRSVTRFTIIVTGVDGRISMFNMGAERMLGFTAEEVVGKYTPELIHNPAEVREQGEALSAKLDRPVKGFEIFAWTALHDALDEREWTFVRKDKTTLKVSLAVSAIRNAAGTVTGFFWIANDITRQKLLEHDLRDNNAKLQLQTARAEEANLAKSTFLAAMSHEIRTPMNAILGMSDLLWESNLDADQRRYVEVFRRAGNVLLDLINSVLDLSKIEAGHMELEIALFDLEDVVTRTVELLNPKAIAKGIQLLYRIAPAVQTTLMGDAVRLQQVLVNLVGNAVKFTETGEVLLHLQNDASGVPGSLAISVTDTGIGISSDQLKSVFEDFNQADASTTRQYGGTGLGLGIAQRLITSMGGHLSATSEVGVGSVFRFNIVLKPGVERRLASRDNVGDLHGSRILVVDNNATNRLILRETLTSWGVISTECGNAEEGAAAILQALDEGNPFAMVLLDRQMPNMDGFAAVPLLRKANPKIPIVMLTSDNQIGDAAKRASSGLSGYAVRPVKRAELLKLICNSLGTAGAIANARSADFASPGDAAMPDTKPLRILVVEDSPDNRLLLEAYLRSSPYLLTFADNGARALAEYKSGVFDLVLMDMQMPVMDGLEASRAIRAYELSAGQTPAPIIALTANALAHDAEASYRAGCNAHLSKPVSKQKLLSALEQYGSPRAIVPDCGTIWIEAPQGLEAFVPEYLSSRQEEYPLLLTCLASADFECLRKKGHDLKGAGTSFGFEEISRIGAVLEQAAKAGNAEAVTRQLRDLGDYLDRVRIVPAQPPVA